MSMTSMGIRPEQQHRGSCWIHTVGSQLGQLLHFPAFHLPLVSPLQHLPVPVIKTSEMTCNVDARAKKLTIPPKHPEKTKALNKHGLSCSHCPIFRDPSLFLHHGNWHLPSSNLAWHWKISHGIVWKLYILIQNSNW